MKVPDWHAVWLKVTGGAAIAVVVFLGAGCGDGFALKLPPGHGVLRFVDHLSQAEISSPLLDIEAIDSIGAIAETPPTTRVEGRLMAERTKNCRVVSSETGGVELECGGGDVEAMWSVPVAGGSYAVIGLGVSTDNTECFRVSVQNGKQEEIGLTLDGELDGGWQRLSTTVIASSDHSDGPIVRLRSQPGRAGCEIRVREITGEEFELGLDRELGLLKGGTLLPGASRDLGLAKQGMMMPTSDMLRTTAPFDDNFTITEAILATTPTVLTFPVEVPEASHLRFRYGRHRGSDSGDAVGFEISAQRRWRQSEVIWTDTVPAGEASWHWREAEVDLARFSKKSLHLTFRTFSPNGGNSHAVWGSPTIGVDRGPDDPPHIIMIAVDTLRADRLSCYGYPDYVSPHIDALAADGVLFEKAFAQSNWTRPSFASIFSGLSVESHGTVGVVDEFDPSVTTLAELLRSAGWSTHGIAYKPALAGRGFEQGFESYFNIPRVLHSAQENLTKAVEFLDRVGQGRFFLFLHFNDPHLPYTHPEPFFSAESRSDVAFFRMSRPVWVYPDLRNCSNCGRPGERAPRFDWMGRRMYVEEIRYLDDRLGMLVEELGRRDLYDNSIVVFVSDHGESLWDHYDQFGHGGKNHHDELIRVPMIIKPHAGWKGPRGSVVGTQVRAFDLMPTVLELVGLGAGELELDADSLIDMMRAPEARPPDRVVVSTNEFASAVRTSAWKFIRPLIPHRGEELLFDLVNDPLELVDVAAEHPEKVAELRLLAAEHALLRHGGTFVVVVSDSPRNDVRCRWSGVAELEEAAHLGLPLDTDGVDGGLRLRRADFQFGGFVGAGRLALLAGFQVPEGETLEVFIDDAPGLHVRDFPIYTAGDLGSLLEESAPGAYGFTSPAVSYRRPNGGQATESRMDAQQLEALRALGYVND